MTTPHIRAGHTDRQAAVDSLTDHFTQGRLSPDEFDDRIGKAYAATYLDELPELFGDLPGGFVSRGRWPSHRPDADWSPDRRYPQPGRTLQRPHPPLVAVVAVVSLLAMFFAVGAISHGFFPFPLLWIVLIAFFVSRRHRHRRWAEHGGHHPRGPR